MNEALMALVNLGITLTTELGRLFTICNNFKNTFIAMGFGIPVAVVTVATLLIKFIPFLIIKLK